MPVLDVDSVIRQRPQLAFRRPYVYSSCCPQLADGRQNSSVVEQLTRNEQVMGSSPISGWTNLYDISFYFRMALGDRRNLQTDCRIPRMQKAPFCLYERNGIWYYRLPEEKTFHGTGLPAGGKLTSDVSRTKASEPNTLA